LTSGDKTGYGTSTTHTRLEGKQMRTRIGLIVGTVLMLAACGTAQPATSLAPTAVAPAATAADATTGMDHGAMAGSEAPYDAQFIDSMIAHHEGAVAMASQVLKEAERAELKTLAEGIISAQTAEIAQLRAWRAAWYPDLPETAGMSMDMGDMEISGDTRTPFDQRFIEAMIPHHEGAIAMAEDAQQKAEHQEIRDLSQAIIAAQEGEIVQMKQWQQAWFGQ
jgi:uncharacterized protein (DUF305 family)